MAGHDGSAMAIGVSGEGTPAGAECSEGGGLPMLVVEALAFVGARTSAKYVGHNNIGHTCIGHNYNRP